MLILVSSPKKLFFCAAEKFIDFEVTFRGRVFSLIEEMGNLQGEFFIGWWESNKEIF